MLEGDIDARGIPSACCLEDHGHSRQHLSTWSRKSHTHFFLLLGLIYLYYIL